MAKNIIIPFKTVFVLDMSDEDMKNLTCISSAKRKNYYEVVEACFHAGLVLLTEHTKCHNHERKAHDKATQKEKIEKSRQPGKS